MSGDYEGMEQQMITQLERAEKAEAERDDARAERDAAESKLSRLAASLNQYRQVIPDDVYRSLSSVIFEREVGA